jgi:hypothetical protein
MLIRASSSRFGPAARAHHGNLTRKENGSPGSGTTYKGSIGVKPGGNGFCLLTPCCPPTWLGTGLGVGLGLSIIFSITFLPSSPLFPPPSPPPSRKWIIHAYNS